MFSAEPKDWRDRYGQQLLFCRSNINDELLRRERETLAKAEKLDVRMYDGTEMEEVAKKVRKEAEVKIPTIDWGSVHWTEGEGEINTEGLPDTLNFLLGSGLIDGEWMEAMVNAEGETALLEWHGSKFTLNPPKARVNPKSISMTIERPRGQMTADYARRAFAAWKTQVQAGIATLKDDYRGWEERVENQVLQILRRKEKAQEGRLVAVLELNKPHHKQTVPERTHKLSEGGRREPAEQEDGKPQRQGNKTRPKEQSGGEAWDSNEQKYDAFMSFAGEDREAVARPLTEELARIGVKVWLDERALQPGQLWEKRLRKAIQEAGYMIIVVSEAWFEKCWPQRESSMGIRSGKDQEERIIPVLVGLKPGDVRFQNHWIGGIQAIVWNNNTREVAGRIRKAIRGNQRRERPQE